MSNFPLWHNDFTCLLQMRQNVSASEKRLTFLTQISVLCSSNAMRLFDVITWEFNIFSPLPHIDSFWRLCSRRLFENMETKEAISPFVTMSSTLFNYCTFTLREFSKKKYWVCFLKSSAVGLLYVEKGLNQWDKYEMQVDHRWSVIARISYTVFWSVSLLSTLFSLN